MSSVGMYAYRHVYCLRLQEFMESEFSNNFEWYNHGIQILFIEIHELIYKESFCYEF